MTKNNNRKYRFQVLNTTPEAPADIQSHWYLRRWKRRNSQFQVIDTKDGSNVTGLSNGGLYSRRGDAIKMARELNHTKDGRLPRKNTRIKRVFQNIDQMAPLWAGQLQSDARCKNSFFEGSKIWSYGKHYLLGELVQYRGATVALVNDEKYSKTTSSHTHSVISAAEGRGLITLRTSGDFDQGAVRRALVRKQGELMDAFFDQFLRTKAFEWQIEYSDLGTDFAEFNAICEKLGHLELVLDVDAELVEMRREYIKTRVNLTAMASQDLQTEMELVA